MIYKIKEHKPEIKTYFLAKKPMENEGIGLINDWRTCYHGINGEVTIVGFSRKFLIDELDEWCLLPEDEPTNDNLWQKVENGERFFLIDKEQIKKLNKWKDVIKLIYGEYGGFDYIFNSDSGIGTSLKVKSLLIDKEIDLTDETKW